MVILVHKRYELKSVVEANATVRRNAEDEYQAVDFTSSWKRKKQLSVAVSFKNTCPNVCINTIEAKVLHFRRPETSGDEMSGYN